MGLVTTAGGSNMDMSAFSPIKKPVMPSFDMGALYLEYLERQNGAHIYLFMDKHSLYPWCRSMTKV
jgi:hypothetical protein